LVEYTHGLAVFLVDSFGERFPKADCPSKSRGSKNRRGSVLGSASWFVLAEVELGRVYAWADGVSGRFIGERILRTDCPSHAGQILDEALCWVQQAGLCYR
jgi:hypothetical protein